MFRTIANTFLEKIRALFLPFFHGLNQHPILQFRIMQSSSPVVAGAAPSVPKHSPFHRPVILIAVATELLQTVQKQTDLVRTAEHS